MNERNLEEKILAVPSKNQMIGTENVKAEMEPQGTPRILFLGNSVTWHRPKEDIGWYGDWGMAASAAEKDYVHLVMEAIRREYPHAVFCITQGSIWETTLENCDYEQYFKRAKEFKADIIVNSLEANIPVKTFDREIFKKELKRLHQYLMIPNKKTRIIMASSMCCIPEKDAAIEEYAKEVHGYYVYVGDIFAKEENLAVGLFEHSGVAHHPGDAGMRCLAERYIKVIKDMMSRKEVEYAYLKEE